VGCEGGDVDNGEQDGGEDSADESAQEETTSLAHEKPPWLGIGAFGIIIKDLGQRRAAPVGACSTLCGGSRIVS